MIGFEIYINDEKPIIMASDHVVSVILGYGYPLGSTISLIGLTILLGLKVSRRLVIR